MVKKTLKDGSEIFLCEVCGLGYLEADTAQKCEDWCSTKNSCNLEITKKAVYQKPF